MTSETLKSSMTDYIIIRVCTLAGFLLIASGSARSHVIMSFLGEILIPTEITLLLWTINYTLILSGLVEIIAVFQILRGNYNYGKQSISLGLLMGLIVLVISIAQQLLIPLNFYDFVIPDLLGWLGIGLVVIMRFNMR